MRDSPQPASRRPSRGRLHGTQHDLRRNRDHLRGGAALERSIRTLHHRQMGPGEQATRPCVANEVIRVFTTWSSKFLLCFQLQLLAWGWKRKTPPERRLGRGSINSNCGTALRHSSLARARAWATGCKAHGGPIQIVDHAWHVGALGCRVRGSLREGCGV